MDLSDDELRRRNLLLLSAVVVVQAAAAATHIYAEEHYLTQAYHTSVLTGRMWVDELIHGHPKRIKTELGVSLHVFLLLVAQLRVLGLTDANNFVKLDEQVAIFLYTCVTGLSTRHVCERFQHTGQTVTKYFRKICLELSGPAFYNMFVVLPSASDPPSPYLRNNPKLWPFFKGCVGALDGTHIASAPSAADRANARNRKGFVSQNVLACCNFAMCFLYLLCGWDGSVTDSHLYTDARLSDFPVPDGCFYLGDAGFNICDAVLIPYRGVRYHLAEWARASQRPSNREELFNLRHSQARNVIERIFGVVKNRWRVLVLPLHYDMDVQARIPAALGALHNFILFHDPTDIAEWNALPHEDLADPTPGYHMDAGDPGVGDIAEGHVPPEETTRATNRRDDIAQAMWIQYQGYLALHHTEMEHDNYLNFE